MIKLMKRDRSDGTQIGDMESVYESQVIHLDTDQGRFTLTVDCFGGMQILAMANDDRVHRDVILVQPEASNKITIHLMKRES